MPVVVLWATAATYLDGSWECRSLFGLSVERTAATIGALTGCLPILGGAAFLLAGGFDTGLGPRPDARGDPAPPPAWTPAGAAHARHARASIVGAMTIVSVFLAWTGADREHYQAVTRTERGECGAASRRHAPVLPVRGQAFAAFGAANAPASPAASPAGSSAASSAS